jgi:hypothetical protein
MKWQHIDTLPEPGHRPGRVFVIVEGHESHSGSLWTRRNAGIARTQNDGFYPEDIRRIEADDHMDRGSGRVTYWMPWCLPPFPPHDGSQIEEPRSGDTDGAEQRTPA